MHGYIHLEPEQWRLIDTPLLQRLRRIRQLAFTSLVYPGATHTRFEHTLGVTHIASRIADATHLVDQDRRLLGLAALLHDIGHGPFSHVSEQALNEISECYNGKTLPEDAHEKIALHLIKNDKPISDHIAPYDLRTVCSILSKTSPNTLLSQAISGPLDIDKQDYLLRDAYFCGVKYGQYDIDRLHHTVRRYPESTGPDLGISPGGIEATEQFVQARYYMHAQVYSHPVRLCTDYMLIRALLLASTSDNLTPLCKAFTYRDTDSFAFDFTSWDDLRILQFAESDASSNSKFSQLMKRLRERRLFKHIFHRKVEDMPTKTRTALTTRISFPTKRSVESAIAEHLGIDADNVIFSTSSLNWGFKRGGPNSDEGGLLVIREGATPLEFRDESLIFQSLSRSLAREFVSVYGPTEDLGDQGSSNELGSGLGREIEGIIDSVLGTSQPIKEVNGCQ